MKRAQKDKLEKALGSHFKEIHKIYVAGSFREESFYSCLNALVEDFSQFFLLQSERSWKLAFKEDGLLQVHSTNKNFSYKIELNVTWLLILEKREIFRYAI